MFPTSDKEISKAEIAKLIGDKKAVIFDIGSYDGSDGIELLSHLNLDYHSRLYCFEADIRSFDILVENYQKFDMHNLFSIYPQNIAICNKNGEIELNISDSETRRHGDNEFWSASSSLRKPKAHLSLFPDVEFKAKQIALGMKLDTFVEGQTPLNGGEIEIVDFIWCDVNGAEEDVILGALNTLKDKTRYLYIEFSDKELYEGQITLEKMLSLLPSFEMIGIYNFQGNFGNVLCKNKNL